jgi:hypothetical protein
MLDRCHKLWWITNAAVCTPLIMPRPAWAEQTRQELDGLARLVREAQPCIAATLSLIEGVSEIAEVVWGMGCSAHSACVDLAQYLLEGEWLMWVNPPGLRRALFEEDEELYGIGYFLDEQPRIDVKQVKAMLDLELRAAERALAVASALPQPPEPHASATASANLVPTAGNESVYSIRRVGEVWHLRYSGERGDYPVNGNRALAWLATILAAPNRRLTVANVLGDSEDKLAAAALLGEQSILDDPTLKEIHDELDNIDAITADTGGSEELEKRKDGLLAELKNSADKRIDSALRKAHKNVATQLRNFFRKLKKGDMPDLGSHLIAFIKLDFPEFAYYPSKSSPAWQV